MAITCRQLLYQENFPDTFELVAGSVETDTEITWFYVESSSFEKGADHNPVTVPGGDELVFVSRNFIHLLVDQQIAYIEKCYRLHAAGMVIVGDVKDVGWSRGFLCHADQIRFPVFCMRNPMELVSVTKRIACLILQEENEEARIRTFMGEMLNEDPKPRSVMLRKGFSCGINLEEPFFFVSIGYRSIIGSGTDSISDGDDRIRFWDNVPYILREIERICRGTGCCILKYYNEWQAFCLIGIKESGLFAVIRRQIDEFLLTYEIHNKIYVRAGYSSISVKAENINTIYQQSEKALEFLRKAKSFGVSVLFSELGMMRYISWLSEEQKCELIEQAKYEMRNLIESDQKNHTNYLQTYRQYLNADGNLLETSEALYIHRNTLIKRLKHIEKLLEKDIRDPHVKAESINIFFIFDYFGIHD